MATSKAKAKKKPARPNGMLPDELPSEFRARKLRAEIDVMLLRAAKKQATAHLSTYGAARVDRRTNDWKSPVSSADMAILDDSTRVNARARQLVRDNWIARSVVRTKARKIVGEGIQPVPTARIDGEELTEFNETIETLFHEWASDRNACDVEGRRTYWQMQSVSVKEKCQVGENFIVWSYTPNPDFVGLQLQCFEVEQLDTTIQSYGCNEVRKGIEVDHYGKAVAYHFFERSINDYLGNSPKSIRIPAERVLHFYDAERSQQSHGISELAPVMMDIRDFGAFKDATLLRARMEACIGLVIKKNNPISSTAPAGMSAGNGQSNTLRNGQRAFDMTPGMVAELEPGEEVNTVIPTTPGNTYGPFTEVTVRGVGAGTGISYGALARKTETNYSGARQDSIEDESEVSPERNLLIDIQVKPVYELFVRFAVFEKRTKITNKEFYKNRRAYLEAEYVPPQTKWIDPEAEALAAEKMIELNLITRKELRARLGGRFPRTMQQIADEKKQAQKLGITFKEDAEKDAVTAKAEAQSPAIQTSTAPATPSPGGIVNTEVNAESSLNGAQITSVVEVLDKMSAGRIVPDVAIELLVAVGIPRVNATEIVKKQSSVPPPPAPEPKSASFARSLKVIEPPNYRESDSDMIRCGTCRWFKPCEPGTKGINVCTAHETKATEEAVCDSWEAPPATDATVNRSIQPPGRAEGERPLDLQSSRDQV